MGFEIPLPASARPATVAVNGIVIEHDAITREAQNHPAETPVAALKAAARALVIRELLLQEAHHLGIEAQPARDDQGRRETDEEAQIRALIEREVVTPEPQVAACRRYYEQNRRALRSPAIHEAAHILLPAAREDTAARENAHRDASAILAELSDQPERFAELARAHSRCPSAAQGGNLGQISPGQTVAEFERALAAMESGEIAREPVETRFGLHIVRLDRRIAGRELPFEMVATRIANYLRQSVENRATAQYIARLISQAEISGIDIEGAEAHRVSPGGTPATLAELVARFRDDDAVAEAVLRLDDLRLVAALGDRASNSGRTLGACAAAAVSRYAAEASADEWTGLLGALASTDDPALEFLRRALAWTYAGVPEATSSAESITA